MTNTLANPKDSAPAARGWQPAAVTPYVTKLAWGMLIFQFLLIVTGATVRLTGSGLGCPTWPTCTTESITNTPEMGIHGYIEFGNRLLGVALGFYSLYVVAALWRLRNRRPDLFVMAVVLMLVVPLQAGIGGITVLTGLNPWVVAAHFLPSAVCIAISMIFLRRTLDSGQHRTPLGDTRIRAAAWTAGVLTAIVVVLGVMVTGAGPHAGDEASARNGFNTLIMARLHAWPVYILVGVTVYGLWQSRRRGLDTIAKAFGFLLGAELVQGVIGYIQYFTGLPVGVVILHIAGLCFVVAAATLVVDSVYAYDPLPRNTSAQRAGTSASAAPAQGV